MTTDNNEQIDFERYVDKLSLSNLSHEMKCYGPPTLTTPRNSIPSRILTVKQVQKHKILGLKNRSNVTKNYSSKRSR